MALHLEYSYANIDASDALEKHVAETLEREIGRFESRLTRVEIHFSDLNSSSKGGHADKRCMLEARPRGRDPIAIDSVADTFYDAASDAAGKMKRALTSRLDRD